MYYKFSLRCSSHRISLFSLLQSLPLRFAVPGFVVHGWKVLGQHRAGRQAAAPAERGDDGTELLGKALDRWGKDAEYIYIYVYILELWCNLKLPGTCCFPMYFLFPSKFGYVEYVFTSQSS